MSQAFSDMSNMVTVSTHDMANHSSALGAIQASLNSSGHIILTGADAAQLSGEILMNFFVENLQVNLITLIDCVLHCKQFI